MVSNLSFTARYAYMHARRSSRLCPAFRPPMRTRRGFHACIHIEVSPAHARKKSFIEPIRVGSVIEMKVCEDVSGWEIVKQVIACMHGDSGQLDSCVCFGLPDN